MREKKRCGNAPKLTKTTKTPETGKKKTSENGLGITITAHTAAIIGRGSFTHQTAPSERATGVVNEGEK
jgi:hypothetical protein